MGNGGSLWWICIGSVRRRRRQGGRRRSAARLVLWGGETREAEPGRTTAGEVMVEHGAGGRVVCRADGFRLGRPAPVLAIEDRLEAGRTYVVLPVDRLPGPAQAVTVASLAALSYDRGSSRRGGSPSSASAARSPFEHTKDRDGRTVISVTQEFVVNAVTAAGRRARSPGGGGDGEAGCGELCSTPELRKHYEQLVVASRGRPWSPRLETIKERKVLDVVSPKRVLWFDKAKIGLRWMIPGVC